MNLQIRKATLDDLDRLMEIFEEARRFMCRTGNPNQWINGYPQRELIQEEIEASHCYVCVTEEEEQWPLSVSFRDPIRPMHALKTGNGETTLLIM